MRGKRKHTKFESCRTETALKGLDYSCSSSPQSRVEYIFTEGHRKMIWMGTGILSSQGSKLTLSIRPFDISAFIARLQKVNKCKKNKESVYYILQQTTLMNKSSVILNMCFKNPCMKYFWYCCCLQCWVMKPSTSHCCATHMPFFNFYFATGS